MIAYIKGSVADAGENFIIIDTGAFGVKVTAPKNICAAARTQTPITLNTHLYIKEDVWQLYGFAAAADLNMFVLLLGVSGVGPKAALSLLDSFSSAEIASAILSDDAKTLSKAQGIGLKTAQMLAFRLKDKLPKTDAVLSGESSEKTEAVNALEVLGYSRGDALKAVLECAVPNMSTQEIIKETLKILRKR